VLTAVRSIRFNLDWLRRRELLALTIVGFVVALALGLVLLSREIETNQKSLRNGNWLAVQIEVEFQRFLNTLSRYGLDEPDVSYSELTRRFDIFWSRLRLTEQGPDGRDLRSDPLFAEMFDELDVAVRAVEPFVLELSKGDRGAYGSILAQLQPFERRLHQLVQHLMLESEQVGRERALKTRYWEIMGAFAGIVVTGALLTLSLLRERRRSERLAGAERATRERAEAASRSKTGFLAVMSHEMRTPLNAVVGFSEMMKFGTFGPLGHARYGEYADIIHRSATHLLEIIASVLDMSRIESGSLHVHRSEFEINPLVQDCLAVIEPRAHDKNIVVLRHLDATLTRFDTDERLLRQILLNLLSNAVKFTPERGRIDVRTGLDGQGRPFVEVVDSGIGIAREDLARIFQPFMQLENESSRRGEGSGLGLSISKGFAEALGGTLALASSRGGGTTATLTLPPSVLAASPSPAPDRAVA
jgi:signal transduction histidine kinase